MFGAKVMLMTYYSMAYMLIKVKMPGKKLFPLS